MFKKEKKEEEEVREKSQTSSIFASVSNGSRTVHTTTTYTSQTRTNVITNVSKHTRGSATSLPEYSILPTRNDGINLDYRSPYADRLNRLTSKYPTTRIMDAKPFPAAAPSGGSLGRNTLAPPSYRPSLLTYSKPIVPGPNSTSEQSKRERKFSYPSIGRQAGRQTLQSLPDDEEEVIKRLVVRVMPSRKFCDDDQTKIPTYTTRSRNRGRMLLINNIKFKDEKGYRKGAEVDQKHVTQLFEQMDFSITSATNLTKEKMEKKIVEFRKSPTLRKVDVCVVVIMSHGYGKARSDSTQISGTDGEMLETTWIISQFDTAACPSLAGKPKIFIFQCCRGEKTDDVPTPAVLQHDILQTDVRGRQMSDMLVAYSTVPGYVSNRDPEYGTWYIQAVCKVFMEHAHNTDIESMLKIVDGMLENKDHVVKQTTSYENRGFKRCYLHPGLSK